MRRYARHACLLTIAITSSLCAQPTSTAPTSKPTAHLENWFGHWKGDAQLIANNRVVQTFVTELIIRPTQDPDRFNWILIYDGKMGRQVREYTLVARDAKNGRYAIDEGQGIVLPATLMGTVLASSFEVMGSRIDATYELRDDAKGPALQMLLVTKKAAEETKTGGKDGVPEVTGWTPISLQTCTLKKVE